MNFQTTRALNNKEKAMKLRFVSICNALFMHGTTDHLNIEKCNYRHLMLPSDVLPEDKNPISSGHLRFNVLKIISPTEYIVQLTAHKAEENEKWQIISGSNEFIDFNKGIQAYYQDEVNQIKLDMIELGKMCIVISLQKFYRAEIIEIIEKK